MCHHKRPFRYLIGNFDASALWEIKTKTNKSEIEKFDKSEQL